MNKTVYYPESKHAKSIYLNEDFLFLSTKKLDSGESFTEAFKDSRTFDSITKVAYKDIRSVSIIEDAVVIQAYMPNEGEKYTLKMELDEAQKNAFVEDLEKVERLNKRVTKQNALKGAVRNIGITLILAVLSYGLITGDYTPGEGRVGRKGRGADKLFEFISSFLGPTLTIVICLLLTLLFGYLAWKKYSNPADKIVFEQA